MVAISQRHFHAAYHALLVVGYTFGQNGEELAKHMQAVSSEFTADEWMQMAEDFGDVAEAIILDSSVENGPTMRA